MPGCRQQKNLCAFFSSRSVLYTEGNHHTKWLISQASGEKDTGLDP